MSVGERERNAQHSATQKDVRVITTVNILIYSVGDFQEHGRTRANFPKAQPVLQSITVRLKGCTHEAVGMEMGLDIGECVRQRANTRG